MERLLRISTAGSIFFCQGRCALPVSRRCRERGSVSCYMLKSYSGRLLTRRESSTTPRPFPPGNTVPNRAITSSGRSEESAIAWSSSAVVASAVSAARGARQICAHGGWPINTVPRAQATARGSKSLQHDYLTRERGASLILLV